MVEEENKQKQFRKTINKKGYLYFMYTAGFSSGQFSFNFSIKITPQIHHHLLRLIEVNESLPGSVQVHHQV